MRTREDILQDLLKIKWDIHHTHRPAYLTHSNQTKYSELISEGRRLKVLDFYDVSVLRAILKQGAATLVSLNKYLRGQPRRDAQKFIGKKNIRAWLFKRDGGCLRCSDTDRLSVDHIVPINRGGLNRLGNLQTLCSSCNSWKSDNYKDFR